MHVGVNDPVGSSARVDGTGTSAHVAALGAQVCLSRCSSWPKVRARGAQPSSEGIQVGVEPDGGVCVRSEVCC